MAEVNFKYNGVATIVQCKKGEKMKDICKKFASKNQIDLNSVFFLYGGKTIDKNLNFDECVRNNSINTMEIIVNDLNVNSEKLSKIILSKDVICPKCLEVCRIDIEDYKIKLYGCRNGHKTENILFSNFEETQKINESAIVCNNCKENIKSSTFNNQFYKCFTCNQNLCPMCRNIHFKSKSQNFKHNIIDYEEINYKCKKHFNESFISYCENCRENLCLLCETEHDNKYGKKEHTIINYKDIMPNTENIETDMFNIKKKIDKIKKNIDDMIKMFNEVKENIDKFYEINFNILKNFNSQNRNYQIIQNINAIRNFDIINDINEIYNDKSLNNKLIYISNIYYKIKAINEIKIRYKINENEERIKIFDNEFVKRNKEHCKIVYNNKVKDLVEYFDIPKDRKKDEDILEIHLKGINKIEDMNSMFYGCTSLVSLPNISEWNTIKVKNMSKLFRGCSSLSYLSKELLWNTVNVKNMESMFSGCTALKNLPDISTWNTINVYNMNELFQGCSLLKNIPDISKWNISNVENLSRLFRNCTNLENLPDISNWNIKNVKNINEIFSGCKSLKMLPDISKWDTENIENMDCIFSQCNSLKKTPDISKWNTSNLIYIGSLFSGC